MSILIKGMEMPKTCGECRFSVDGWCYAFASNDAQPGYIKSYEKAKWCPIIKVPPHGRLIDADALEDRCSRQARDEWNKSTGTNWGYAYAAFESDVEDAPTIIPADKDGESR